MRILRKFNAHLFLISFLQIGTSFAIEPSSVLSSVDSETLDWDDQSFLETMTIEFASLFETSLSRDANGTFLDSRAHDLFNLHRFVLEEIESGKWNGFGPSFDKRVAYTFANQLSKYHSVPMSKDDLHYSISVYSPVLHNFLVSAYKALRTEDQRYESSFAKQLKEEATNLDFDAEYNVNGTISDPRLAQKMEHLADLFTKTRMYARLWEMMSERSAMPGRETRRIYAAKLFLKLQKNSNELGKVQLSLLTSKPSKTLAPSTTSSEKTLAPPPREIKTETLPWAIVVSPGKLVKSPFPHNGDGLVDVTGFFHGQKVRCPYTGKIFRVP